MRILRIVAWWSPVQCFLGALAGLLPPRNPVLVCREPRRPRQPSGIADRISGSSHNQGAACCISSFFRGDKSSKSITILSCRDDFSAILRIWRHGPSCRLRPRDGVRGGGCRAGCRTAAPDGGYGAGWRRRVGPPGAPRRAARMAGQVASGGADVVSCDRVPRTGRRGCRVSSRRAAG